MQYYSGSHLHDLPTKKGERSLHEISKLALDGVGCEAKEIDFADGGL